MTRKDNILIHKVRTSARALPVGASIEVELTWMEQYAVRPTLRKPQFKFRVVEPRLKVISLFSRAIARKSDESRKRTNHRRDVYVEAE